MIDVQQGVMEQADQRHAVTAHISALVDRARAENVPIVWVQHSDERDTGERGLEVRT